jgi:hypothetical protein
MTPMPTIAAVQPLTGTGLVQRHGDTVVVVDARPDDGFTAAVLSDCNALAGEALVRQLARRVLELPTSNPRRLCVVTTADGGPLAYLHGDVELRTPDDVFTAAGLVTGIDVDLENVSSLTVVPSGAVAEDGERSDLGCDLGSGVVAASGFHLDFAPFPPPEVECDPTIDDLVSSVAATVGPDLLAAAEARGSSELEASVVPVADDDAITIERPAVATVGPVVGSPGFGPSVQPAELDGAPPTGPAPTVRLHPVSGPRPSLGVFVLDDGTAVPVTRDLVLGREPDGHALVAPGGAVAVAMSDPHQTVSRAHAHVSVEGVDAHLADLGSSNGTFVRPGPNTGWVEVAGADRIRLTAGAVIRLGDRELVFESHDLVRKEAS